MEYTKNNETIEKFWKWSGMVTIGATIGGKGWIDQHGKVCPNLFALIIAPPGKCRKGSAIKTAQWFLDRLGIDLAAQSPGSPQQFIQQFANSEQIADMGGGKQIVHSSFAALSDEFSSLLSCDTRKMIAFMTNLFDFHEKWDHRTKTVGDDFIHGACFTLFAATTPNWFTQNLPVETIGDGFASRLLLVTGTETPKRYAEVVFDKSLRSDLLHDLEMIMEIKGRFRFDQAAKERYLEWYDNEMNGLFDLIKDSRLHGFVSRFHTNVQKVAIIQSAARGGSRIITLPDLERAFEAMYDLIPGLTDAFGGIGKNRYSHQIHIVADHIRTVGKATPKEILLWNCNDLYVDDLTAAIKQLREMEVIEEYYNPQTKEVAYRWTADGDFRI